MDAIEFMTMPITGKNPTVESLLETMAEDTKKGKAALSEAAQILGDGK